MKKIIIILGTIILGVYIVSSLIMGDGDSLKSSATTINKSGVNAINTMIKDIR